MTVVTRFAPSPTGFLHIGGARTALFNWLFARHHNIYGDGGLFRLRIEDTDRVRSSEPAVQAIYRGLKWMGLDWDGKVVSQFSNRDAHQSIANKLLNIGKAYKCFCSPQELQEMRQIAKKDGNPVNYNGFWRDRDPSLAPKGVNPVIRLRTPLYGQTVIEDLVQGEVCVNNAQIDDMVLIRSDGTPTYMLASVVDDHDMAVTHVIRGDDHLTNAFRQFHIYKSLNWKLPKFAHISLIHGHDGSKMSKRHGALGIEDYRDKGLLPDALKNYLLRLGWSHGDEEIISEKDAVKWFSLETIGKSAARFDEAKLINFNSHYLRKTKNSKLNDLVLTNLRKDSKIEITKDALTRIANSMNSLKVNSKTLLDLTKKASIFLKNRPINFDNSARKVVSSISIFHISNFRIQIDSIEDWTTDKISTQVNEYLLNSELKLRNIAPVLRVILLGELVSHGIFEIMDVLGKEETILRLNDYLEKENT